MNKPKKFKNYVAALLDETYGYPHLAAYMFRVYDLEPSEADECKKYLDYVVEHDIVEREICHIEEAEFEFIGSDDHKKGIARCYVCSECQDMIEQDANYCPNCGAKVV